MRARILRPFIALLAATVAFAAEAQDAAPCAVARHTEKIFVDFLRNTAAPAGAETPASAPASPAPMRAATIAAAFTCDAGKSVKAVFVDGPRSSVRLSLSDGREISLPQGPSGSGARYANGDDSFVFWNKGNTAFIEEGGKTTYSGCVTRR